MKHVVEAKNELAELLGTLTNKNENEDVEVENFTVFQCECDKLYQLKVTDGRFIDIYELENSGLVTDDGLEYIDGDGEDECVDGVKH